MAFDTHLLAELSDISAYEAFDLLCTEFSLGGSCISFIRTRNRAEVRTFLTANYLQGVSASDVGPIEFWGGPPQKKSYYSGTLLTYLFDAILHSHALNGNYAELIQNEAD